MEHDRKPDTSNHASSGGFLIVIVVLIAGWLIAALYNAGLHTMEHLINH